MATESAAASRAATGPPARRAATTSEAEPTGSRHLGLALIVISLAQLMLVLDELIVNTALPHVQRALHFSGTSLEWVVTGYAVTFGGLLLLGGRAGDIFGRRRMFVSGIVVFSLSSLFGGLATSEAWLIAARALQGIGAAMAAPAALSLIAVTFPEGKQRTRALSVYAAMTGMGGAIGLIAGGLLTTYATWRWVFFVNVVIGVPLLLGTRYAIPETKRHPRRFDLPGVMTGSLGFALLVYGLSHGATGPDGVSHWGDASTVAALAGAAASLTSFFVIEARTAEPLLPLRILRDRNRIGVYVMLLFLAAAFFGMFFFVTLFLQTIWGYSAIKAGAAYLPFIGTFIIVSGICSQLVPRIGVRIPMTIGAPGAAGAMFWLSRVGVHSPYVTGVMLPFIVFALAAGLIFVPLTMTLVAGISDEDSGVASSMFNAGQQVGGAVGLATIGTVAWSAFNHHVKTSLAHVAAPLSHAATHAVASVSPGTPIYDNALSNGVARGLTIGAVGAALAFVVALVTIRVRREDLPKGMVVV
jgi:EmrB/QacA subfamily drug resistance transporter